MKKIRLSSILYVACALGFSGHAMEAAPQGTLATVLGLVCLGWQQASGDWVNRYSTNVNDPTVRLGYDVATIDDVRVVGVGNYRGGSFIAEIGVSGDSRWAQSLPDTRLSGIEHVGNEDFFVMGTARQDDAYGDLWGLRVTKLGVDAEDPDPVTPYWVHQSLFGFHTEEKDMATTSDDGVVVVGSVYGAFTSNTSFTLKPRAFVARYNTFGGAPSVVAFGTLDGWDEARSVVYEDEGVFSVVGLSTYDTGGGNLVPMLSLTEFNDGGSVPVWNGTRIFAVGVVNTTSPSTTEGIVGLAHTKTSTGYGVTGVLLNFSTEAGAGGDYKLFVANLTEEGGVVWIKKLGGMALSAGFGIVEEDDHYTVVGSYGEDRTAQHMLLLKVGSDGELMEDPKKLDKEGYDVSAGFAVKTTMDGSILVPGGITYNNSVVTNVDFLLGSGLEDFMEPLTLNLEVVPVILAHDLQAHEVTMPQVYVLESAVDFTVEEADDLEATRLYETVVPENDDDDDGLNAGEITGIVLGSVGGAVLLVTLVGLWWCKGCQKMWCGMCGSCGCCSSE